MSNGWSGSSYEILSVVKVAQETVNCIRAVVSQRELVGCYLDWIPKITSCWGRKWIWVPKKESFVRTAALSLSLSPRPPFCFLFLFLLLSRPIPLFVPSFSLTRSSVLFIGSSFHTLTLLASTQLILISKLRLVALQAIWSINFCFIKEDFQLPSEPCLTKNTGTTSTCLLSNSLVLNLKEFPILAILSHLLLKF